MKQGDNSKNFYIEICDILSVNVQVLQCQLEIHFLKIYTLSFTKSFVGFQ